MEAVIVTVLICSFVCGGVLLEALAPHLPALLGLDGGVRATRTGKAVPAGRGRSRSVVELARRVEALQAERDFYRALVEPPVVGPEEGDRHGRSAP